MNFLNSNFLTQAKLKSSSLISLDFLSSSSTLSINFETFNAFETISNIFALYRIWFKSTLINEVNQYIINNNKSLEEYFRANGQQIKDYNLDIKELEILEIDKLNKVPMSFIKWKNYVVKNCELDTKELVLYEEFYKVLMSEQKKKITCLIYESFLYLGPASYFGDSALDSETNKRNTKYIYVSNRIY